MPIIDQTEQFERKGHGRIFVKSEADKKAVLEIAKEIDEFEVSYMPSDFIAVCEAGSPDKFDVVYGHKFELNIWELYRRCFLAGICIWCVTQREDGWSHIH